MLSSLPQYVLYILAVVVSAIVSLYSVKKILFIARKRKIYDIPDNIRKIHGEEIPSLGGIGVFIGYMATIPLFVVSGAGWNYIIISTVILFFTGIYDDLMNMRPSKKLLAQLIASAVTVYFADIRIGSLYGIFGINELSYWVSIGLTTFCCTFFINVFNFIDGIDGLASMMAMLYCIVFGGLFVLSGHSPEACISFCLLGATAGLLYYNYPPAKIYMGDTGSMLTGFSVFILALSFIHYATANDFNVAGIVGGSQAYMIVIATLFLPVFDALRVFVLRAAKGISPLKADRRHLHYYLLDSGLSHSATAWTLIGANILTVVIAFVLSGVPPFVVLPVIALPSVILSFIAQWRYKSSK